jgi:DNA-binding MarR family transcriptional regulator
MSSRDEELRQAIELLFFAYRDFTGEADAILGDYDFGRAHHRVIYFVGRNPEITVTQLLAILKITKQSLARVLRQLLEEGFVEQKTDAADRRRRLHVLTPKGVELDTRLTKRQSHRIAAAYETAGPQAIDGFRQILRSVINQEDREYVDGFFGDRSSNDDTD